MKSCKERKLSGMDRICFLCSWALNKSLTHSAMRTWQVNLLNTSRDAGKILSVSCLALPEKVNQQLHLHNFTVKFYSSTANILFFPYSIIILKYPIYLISFASLKKNQTCHEFPVEERRWWTQNSTHLTALGLDAHCLTLQLTFSCLKADSCKWTQPKTTQESQGTHLNLF